VTAAPSIPSIAARHISYRVDSCASWAFMKSRSSVTAAKPHEIV
jgi:hypothetical protein